MSDRTRYYTLQRNYQFDSHDKDGNFNGLTKEDWKKQICEDWSCDNLNASHVVIIFHDKDMDDNGMLKELHAHACAYFTDAITQSEALKRSKCSSDSNCKQIKNKSQAYRYLLHITEKAIKDNKHIYSEDELIIEVAKNKKFDYHKMIQASDEEESEKDAKKQLKNTIMLITQGFYGEDRIMQKLLLEDELVQLMSMKTANKRAIENAIETYQESCQAKAIKLSDSTQKQKFDFNDMLKRFTQ